MIELKDRRQNRRDFLQTIVRYIILLIIAFVTGALFIKKRAESSDKNCYKPGICQGCISFKDCDLPKALSARKVMAG